MKKLCCLILILSLSLSPTVSFGHSGRTDSNGGHNSSTGYHYHHGYPAHQHENGQCPYEFDDKTGWSSGTSSGGNGNEESPTITKPDNDVIVPQEKHTSLIGSIIGYAFIFGLHVLIAFSVLLFIYIIFFDMRPKNKNIITKLLNRIENFIFLPEKVRTNPIYRNIKYHDCFAEPIGPKTFEEHVKESTTVYITKSGARYHLQSCTMIKKNAYPVTLKAAEKHGYKPCSKCNPPK